MSKRKRPPEALPIANIIARMTEENASVYQVADHAKVDWCPCCGVNLRFYDADGKLFAKLICKPEVMFRLGHDINAQSLQMMRMCPDEASRARAQADVATAIAPQ